MSECKCSDRTVSWYGDLVVSVCKSCGNTEMRTAETLPYALPKQTDTTTFSSV